MVRSVFKYALKLVSAVVAVFTLLSYVAPHVNPVVFPWFSFFGTAFPWLLFANLALLAIWASRLNRFALYHLGLILVGWQYMTGFIGFNGGRDVVPEKSISVVTHNLGALFRGKKMTDALREKTADAYVAFLEKNGAPDILCTQETSGKFYRLVAEKMGYEHTFNLKKGTVILSKYPMEGGGDIPFGKTANSTLWVDVRIDGRTVRVYNVHLQSNKVTNDTEKVIEEGELEKETWHEIGSVLGKVGSATKLRTEQAQRLHQHITECTHPVIVCGDFNDTPNSFVYRLLSEGMNDTFRDKALGFGTTFAGVLPLLRIDYVLTDLRFKTYSCKTLRGNFSDHYPVRVDLGLK
ncbi:MAG: endonuclease/exonuclease/phosphatase family protein [Saprospiraceae bacterium]|nr:endonuclease/exonuclease/phosphatase family protein [Saprospiraceae bacterium]